MAHAPLSVEEREEIARGLIIEPTVAWAVLARRVSRHAGTIAREVQRNGGRQEYRASCAQGRAERARLRPRTLKLAAGPLRDHVTAELRLGRSPVAISADLTAAGGLMVCAETIYGAVYNGVLDVRARDCLRLRRPRRRHRQTRSTCSRPVLPSITDRPAVVNDRAEPGHWEVDAIIGARNRSAMLWLCERVTKFSIPVTMPLGYAADATLAGLVEALEQIPAHLRLSLTFDRGSEWAEWETLKSTYELSVWFCDPHSPWQRGQIEHHNRAARWWFPRGSDLSTVTPAHAQHVADIINGQRRRSLDWHSPTHRYAALAR